MRTRHKKKFQNNNSVSMTVMPVQAQFGSRPLVDLAQTKQQLTQTKETEDGQMQQQGRKLEGFNFASMPIFAGTTTAHLQNSL